MVNYVYKSTYTNLLTRTYSHTHTHLHIHRSRNIMRSCLSNAYETYKKDGIRAQLSLSLSLSLSSKNLLSLIHFWCAPSHPCWYEKITESAWTAFWGSEMQTKYPLLHTGVGAIPASKTWLFFSLIFMWTFKTHRMQSLSHKHVHQPTNPPKSGLARAPSSSSLLHTWKQSATLWSRTKTKNRKSERQGSNLADIKEDGSQPWASTKESWTLEKKKKIEKENENENEIVWQFLWI